MSGYANTQGRVKRIESARAAVVKEAVELARQLGPESSIMFLTALHAYSETLNELPMDLAEEVARLRSRTHELACEREAEHLHARKWEAMYDGAVAGIANVAEEAIRRMRELIALGGR